jgi:hypothetical protein
VIESPLGNFVIQVKLHGIPKEIPELLYLWDMATWKHGDIETWRNGDIET